MKQNILTTSKLAGIILSISLLMSCSNEKTVDNGYYFENFDNLKHWSNGNHATVTNEVAHSGWYAAFTDSMHDFSQTFNMDVAGVTSKGFRHVNVTAWCYKTTEKSSTGLIVSVEDGDKTIFRQELDFNSRIEKTNEWEMISTVLDLPEAPSANARFKLYMWSPDKEKAFLDDVTIEFIK